MKKRLLRLAAALLVLSMAVAVDGRRTVSAQQSCASDHGCFIEYLDCYVYQGYGDDICQIKQAMCVAKWCTPEQK